MASTRSSLFSVEKPHYPLILGCWIFCLGISLLLPSEVLQNIFIFFSLGHFLSSVVFQKKPRNLKPARIFFVSIAAVVAFSGVYLFTEYFMFLTVFWFLIHFFLDELHLLEEKLTPHHWIAVLPILLLIPLQFFRVPIKEGWALGLAMVCLLSLLKPTPGSSWLSLLSLSVCAMVFFKVGHPPVISTLGFLVLLHYLHWYLAFPVKRKMFGAPLRKYLMMIFLIQGVVAVLWGLTQIDWMKDLNKVTFDLYSFYAWTFVHLVATVRGLRW